MSDGADYSTLPKDWAGGLAGRKFDGDVDQLVGQLYARDAEVFPPRRQVFRAFHLTSLASVRVVILGQDPYPRQGQAHGLAFSVPEGVRVPRSLSTIYSNLTGDPAVEFSRPASGDLTAWAENGVLLLNTALTVDEGVAGSHAAAWRQFSNVVLQVINDECDHVAFLLWGRHAISTATSLPVDERRHKLIRSAHPAARGKTKERRFADSRPFSEANDFLSTHPLGRVNWSLGASAD